MQIINTGGFAYDYSGTCGGGTERRAYELGYHVMCEKPMSPDPAECLAMGEWVKKSGKTMTVCHVLRYSPFFTEIKRVVDSGAIGELASVQHMENVGFWHQAHSFVRGNWRNSDETTAATTMWWITRWSTFCFRAA